MKAECTEIPANYCFDEAGRIAALSTKPELTFDADDRERVRTFKNLRLTDELMDNKKLLGKYFAMEASEEGSENEEGDKADGKQQK